jgi:beta propeller repeat protein
MRRGSLLRSGAASRITLCALVALFVLAVAAPVVAQRHVTRKAGPTSSSMSWTSDSFTPFAKPAATPGDRQIAVDGKLIACRTGVSGGARGFDISYRFHPGAHGVWGGAGDQTQPAVSQGLIAGLDRSRVAVFDPAKAAAVTVSDPAAAPSWPAFSGSVVVWQDHRGADWDIYARRFDRATGQPSGDVFPICTAAGDQTAPAVDGDLVVWQDARGGSTDVYAYDLATAQESAICTATGAQEAPDVCGQVVVWQDHRGRTWDVYARDLSTAAEWRTSDGSGDQTQPAVSDSFVVWQDSRPMDVSFERPNGAGVERHYPGPFLYQYSLAARQTMGGAMWGGSPTPVSQRAPDVSGSLFVWLSVPRGSPTRGAGSTVSEFWAYSIAEPSGDTSYGSWTNSPQLTFGFSVQACPSPPVAEVGIAFGRDVGGELPWTWMPFAAQATVTLPPGDGRKLWSVSMRDSAGGTPGAEGSEITLDTHGPQCWAPEGATVKSGRTATLRYKVTDKLSPKALAVVTITHVDGSVAATLPARMVGTGAMVDRRFTCDLPAGDYVFTVTATDLAGNQQTRAGSNQLIVR